MFDETGGKVETKGKKCLTSKTLMLAKPNLKQHRMSLFWLGIILMLMHILHSLSLRINGCNKLCIDAIKKNWSEAYISSTETGYIRSEIFMNIFIDHGQMNLKRLHYCVC